MPTDAINWQYADIFSFEPDFAFSIDFLTFISLKGRFVGDFGSADDLEVKAQRKAAHIKHHELMAWLDQRLQDLGLLINNYTS